MTLKRSRFILLRKIKIMNTNYSDNLFFGSVDINSLVSVPKPFEYSLSNNKFNQNVSRTVDSLFDLDVHSGFDCHYRNKKTIAEKVLEILTNKNIGGNFVDLDLKKRKEILKRINDFINSEQPIEMRLLSIPFKCPNPLKVRGSLPDLGEYFSIMRLLKINSNIKKVYSPGVRFNLVAESLAFYNIFEITKNEAITYRDSFVKMVKDLKGEKVIKVLDLMESLDMVLNFKTTTRLMEKKFINSKLLIELLPAIVMSVNTRNYSIEDLMLIFDRNKQIDNLPESIALGRKEIFKRALKATVKYISFHKARELLDTSEKCFPGMIACSVVPKKGSITILPIGNDLLPHHGVGVLKRDGTVETRYEIDLLRSNYQIVYQENKLNIIAYEEI